MEGNINIQDYLSDGVEWILKDAIRTTLKNPKESFYLLKFSKHARRATKIRRKYSKKGQNIPAFLIASITSRCNLHCTGCYSRANNSCSDDVAVNQLSANDWEGIFNQAKDLGISFIVLAGGEPLIRQDVIAKATEYPEILFPLFTNGTMIDDDYLNLFDDNRNIVPVISIEGDEKITDLRRGEGVYGQIVDAMESMKKKSIPFGTSMTFTKGNLSALVSDEFIDQLHEMGCKVVFFIEYVPVNKETIDLAPSDSERELLLGKMDELRENYSDMIFLSFPGDEKTSGGCLAAGRGFFHINSIGGAEPCPASPYSDVNVRDKTLIEALNSKLFKSLRDGGLLMDEHECGCVLFEHEEDVKRLLDE